MVHPLPGGRAAVLSRDLVRTRTSLDALHPGDGARWQALVEPYLEHWERGARDDARGFPPVAGPAKLAAGLKPRGMLDFARLLLMPAEALARELFRGEGAAWLYGSSLHGDAPLDGGRQRDLRRLAEPPGPRRRLAERRGRRREHRRRARRVPARARRPDAHVGAAPSTSTRAAGASAA